MTRRAGRKKVVGKKPQVQNLGGMSDGEMLKRLKRHVPNLPVKPTIGKRCVAVISCAATLLSLSLILTSDGASVTPTDQTIALVCGYGLLPTSPYHNQGTDGRDIGIDAPALARATCGVIEGKPCPYPVKDNLCNAIPLIPQARANPR